MSAICRAAGRSNCGSRTRPGSGRRTGSSGNGPAGAPPPTSATRTPGCSARSVPPEARRPIRRCRLPAQPACSCISTRDLALRRTRSACCSPARSRWVAYDTQTQTAAKRQPDLLAGSRARAKPGRKYLAVFPCKLAVQHRVQRHRALHRRCLLSLEQSHGLAGNHPIHRSQKVDPHRSASITVGIMSFSVRLRRLRRRHLLLKGGESEVDRLPGGKRGFVFLVRDRLRMC